MKLNSWRWNLATGGLCTLLLAGLVLITTGVQDLKAASWFGWVRSHGCDGCGKGCVGGECPPANGVDELGGTWYWLRSPEEEKRITMGLYNRYCIRCHGVDGRGVWDIPGVPNFTDTVWQGSRSDAQIVRSIVEGRGAVCDQSVSRTSRRFDERARSIASRNAMRTSQARNRVRSRKRSKRR